MELTVYTKNEDEGTRTVTSQASIQRCATEHTVGHVAVGAGHMARAAELEAHTANARETVPNWTREQRKRNTEERLRAIDPW